VSFIIQVINQTGFWVFLYTEVIKPVRVFLPINITIMNITAGNQVVTNEIYSFLFAIKATLPLVDIVLNSILSIEPVISPFDNYRAIKNFFNPFA